MYSLRSSLRSHFVYCIFRKLEGILQKSHFVDEQNVSMRRKQQDVLSENQELKGKLIDLRGKLMDKSVEMNNLEGKYGTLLKMACYLGQFFSSGFGRPEKGSELCSEGIVY